MEIHETRPVDQVSIEGYGDGGFRLQGEFYAGSILLLPDRRTPWVPAQVGEVTIEAIDIIGVSREGFDLLLIGTGAKRQALPPEGRDRLTALNIAHEVMGTGAACRTYNVLIAEGRRVAAALIAVA